MKGMSTLQIGNIVALIVTLIINFFSQSGSQFAVTIFPNTVKDLAESRAVFFLPDGYVFGIWGIIYTGLLAYIIYTSRPSQRNSEINQKIGYWFIISSIANSVWLILFLNDLVFASTIAMVVLFISLFIIYTRLEIGIKPVSNVVRWCVHIPFSIYIGWITVATVANFATWLYTADFITSFVGITADVWTVIMMAIATVIALGMLYFRKDIAYALVPIWAFVGIYARPFDTEIYELVTGLDPNLVNTASLVFSGVIGLGIVLTIIRMLMARNSENNSAQVPLAQAS